jgi:hypothetical protein
VRFVGLRCARVSTCTDNCVRAYRLLITLVPHRALANEATVTHRARVTSALDAHTLHVTDAAQ